MAEEGEIDLVAGIVGGAKFAAELLEDEGLAGLARLEAEALSARLRAVGCARSEAKGRALAAAFEIGRRVVAADARAPPRIASGTDVVGWAMPRLSLLAHEELWVLALDGRSRLRVARCVAKGGLHALSARACDPLRAALRADASAIVLVHNHPSGDPTPSAEDVRFTAAVNAAAETVGVPLLDHVVVAREGFAVVPVPGA